MAGMAGIAGTCVCDGLGTLIGMGRGSRVTRRITLPIFIVLPPAD